MFTVESLLECLTSGQLILIQSIDGQSLFSCCSPAMIPWDYRAKMVQSVIQTVDAIIIKIYYK